MSEHSQENVRSLPLVSIITVVYNNAQYIRDSIQSVLSQDYARLEYVVIDGGSNDGTVEIIQEFRDHISVFISERDKGIYDALNKGIQHASGEVVGVLHSGDLFCNENVVSASGTALSAEQVNLIGRLTKNMTLLFDGDDAGLRASFKSILFCRKMRVFLAI